jgi:hypothetical protein
MDRSTGASHIFIKEYMPHTKNTSVICCRILLLERVKFKKKKKKNEITPDHTSAKAIAGK